MRTVKSEEIMVDFEELRKQKKQQIQNITSKVGDIQNQKNPENPEQRETQTKKRPENPENPEFYSGNSGNSGGIKKHNSQSVMTETQILNPAVHCTDVTDEKRHVTVRVCLEKTGETIELVDNIVKISPKYNVYYFYKGQKYDDVKAILKKTGWHPSKKEILDAIEELKEEPVEIPVVQYSDPVVDKIVEEIKKDPVGWFLQKSSWVVGYTKYKIAVLVSATSSMLPNMPGIKRVHLVLEGNPGVGKTSIIKSILRYFPNAIMVTDLSQNALVYMPVKNFNGKIIFVEQLEYIRNYVRENLSEDRICKTVTVTVEGETPRAETICIEGQPAWVTTIVNNNLNDEILSRMLRISVREEKELQGQIVESILKREALPEVTTQEKIAVAKWLHTLKFEVPDLDQFKQRIMSLGEYSKRAFELLRNTSMVLNALGRLDLLDQLFPYILYSAMGVSEEELMVLQKMGDNVWTTAQLSEAVNISQPRLRKILNSLTERNLVDDNYYDKQHHWSLTQIGRQLVSAFGEDVVKVGDSLYDAKWWKKFLYEHFGFRGFSTTELTGLIQGLSVEEAEKMLQQLHEAGVVGKGVGDGLWYLQGGVFG